MARRKKREEGKEKANTARRGLSLRERIAIATQDDYEDILPELAALDPIERELFCKALAERLKVGVRAVINKVKLIQNRTSIPPSKNNIIAHPAFYVHKDFMTLGFRETVIVDEKPMDRNFFILAQKGGYELHDRPVIQHTEYNIIFEERERLLLRAEDRWPKERIERFINKPGIPNDVYEEIKKTVQKFVELQNDATYGLIAAWVIATYFHRLFNSFPFIYFPGPKGSGKTRALDVLERLTFNGMKIKGISVAALADSIDGVRGTFLNDQAEALSDKRAQEILGILADSYTLGGGRRRVVHISNQRRRVLEFETYGPKAFASIKDIDSDLKDRCIEIKMLRSIGDYAYPDPILPIWKDLRDKLYRLLLTKWQTAREVYQNTGGGMTHRTRELWRPIETILLLEKVSKQEIDSVRQCFLESMIETQYEITEAQAGVIETLLEMLRDTNEAIFTAAQIADKLTCKPHSGITEKGLQTWVGKMINQFSLYNAHAGRKDGRRAYWFRYDHVENVLKRYSNINGGLSGQVVNCIENQQDTCDHMQKRMWLSNHISGNDTALTTSKPHAKTDVVAANLLNLKESDHIATSDANSAKEKAKNYDWEEGQII